MMFRKLIFSLFFTFFLLSSLKSFAELKVSGNLQLDELQHLSHSDNTSKLSNGALLRNFSLSLFKEFDSKWSFIADLSFSASASQLGPLFLNYKVSKQLELLIGQIPSPFCLENSNSSKWLAYLEKSNVTSTFKPCIGPGFSFHYSYKNAVLKWGVRQAPLGFEAQKSSLSQKSQNSDKLGTSLRLTGFRKTKEQGLFHLGASFSYQEINESVNFSVKGEVKTRENLSLLTTGDIEALSYQVSAAEFAYQYSSLLLQTEFLNTTVERRQGLDSLRFSGYQFGLSFLFNGLRRRYKLDDGVFQAPHFNDQAKAYELAFRLSQISLNDDKLRAGELQSITVACNWYISPSIKLASNLVRSIKKKDNEAKEQRDSFALRLQTLF